MRLSAIVTCHRCTQDAINLAASVQADFMLAYYMVHEVPDLQAFFNQACPLLKPGGRFLVVEPLFHVSRSRFKTICAAALAAGFKQLDTPKGKGGRTLLLTR